jgi:hypothetical protein
VQQVALVVSTIVHLLELVVRVLLLLHYAKTTQPLVALVVITPLLIHMFMEVVVVAVVQFMEQVATDLLPVAPLVVMQIQVEVEVLVVMAEQAKAQVVVVYRAPLKTLLALMVRGAVGLQAQGQKMEVVQVAVQRVIPIPIAQPIGTPLAEVALLHQVEVRS